MSLITRVRRLFSQPEAAGTIGVSIKNHDLDYCALGQQQTVCNSQLVVDGQYHQVIEKLSQKIANNSQCNLVLCASQNHIVQIDKPQVPEAEVNSAVKWQIKDLVSIAPEDMIVDYFDGPKLAGGLEKINVVCADKNMLSQYITPLIEQGLSVDTITIEEFAFASLLPPQNEAKLLVCKQPGEGVLLLIVKNGDLYFHRRIRGLEQVELKSQEELDLSVIDSLSLEIQRSTDYFERQLKQAPIRSIEVLLPMEHEAFVARRLSENTDVTVNIFTMPEGFSEYRQFAACVGAIQLMAAGRKHHAKIIN
ncbi:hypothetical protein [Thalassotalea sp. G2M2-11]|uniref:hypothetical protein n=1 Tax=Thalassotalea sp. G2M2-11 TaxID=2787627 RepID=UPI0019D1F384|nr:hypothetical protein [Thalassotalea sp. G2M2-11]